MFNRLRLAVIALVALFAVSAFAADYNVYVGTYTGPNSKGIYLFHFDPATGKFTQPSLAAETDNPSFLALDPQHHFLYAVNELDSYKGQKSGAVSAFSIDPKTDKLKFLQQVASLGGAPAYITVDHTGRNVLVANYNGGNVVVFPIKPDGTLGDHTALDQHHGKGPNPERQEAPHAHEIVLSPDNRFALSPDLGLDHIIIDRFDAAHGTLTPNDPPFATVAPGSGPRHIIFDHTGKFAYVLSEMGQTVTVFSYNAKTGAMHNLQVISTVAKPDPANTAAELNFDPSGRFLYTSTRTADVITQFAVDRHTGKLKLVSRTPSGGKEPRFFTLDPTGHWMFVAHQNSDDIILFRVDAKTGKITPHSRMKLGSPVCLVFTPGSEKTAAHQ